MGGIIQNIYTLSDAYNNQPVGSNMDISNKGANDKLVINSIGTITHTGSQIYYTDMLKASLVINESERVFDRYESQINLTQQLGFVEIPIHLNYYLLKGRFNIAFNLGVGMNYLIRNQIMQEHKHIGITKDIRQFNWAGLLSIQLEMPLVNKLNLYFEPRYRYFLNSINRDNTIVESHPYSFGIHTGMLYRF